ncbi:lipopolysaccharide heptosyltransferase II [Leptospira broomii serovar Hurstbridge str. 5399]|uniref:lipopolysaccharide heptosyltransferase II n=1 Tax=Leptospira broomii serovar Hurstbridge str. 5399 TaxID=1049789 RepID=T0GGU5_9LEPT|nr:lipopolysaccharide heptosyltransferase II [Leptospira broomii]EQA46069.1 lipopolysaccharide heptosyltransferase II [Leptospira broomii serovar Hurstbridge str. 5399]
MTENILLIQTAFLGDLILTTPLFREVKRKYPRSKLTVIVNKGTESVLEANPWIDEIIPLDKKVIKSSMFGFWNFTLEIRKRKFTLCIVPHFSFRSSLIAWRSRAPRRIGYKTAGFSFLLTERKSRPIKGPHEVDKLLSLLYSEEELKSVSRRPELFWKEESVKGIQEILKKKNLEKGKYVLIAPSSVWETKRMPAEKFREVGKSLKDKTGLQIVLTGGKGDIPLCEEVGSGFAINLAGQTTLQEMSYLMSGAALLVTNDSSPIHFASAFDVPTLAVFGATVPDFGYTPLATRTFISEIQGLPCRPCGIHGGRVCPEGHFRCMLEQNPNRIVQEALRLIGR